MSNDLLENLRQAVLRKAPSTHVHTIKWPSGIQPPPKMDDGNGCCKICLSKEALTSNMQEDASAFEGWSLVIRAWLAKEGITSVELSWEDPGTAVEEDGHYQRFLYRVIRFNQMFDWFSVAEESKKQLLKSRILVPDGSIKPGEFYLNTEGTRENNFSAIERTADQFKKMTEHEAELLFMTNQKPLLESVFASKISGLGRQLPVGLFAGLPSKKDNGPIFSHGKSAVDLWAANDEKVVLFELKKPSGNKRVGAISELFFYVNVISDLQNENFKINDIQKFEKLKGLKKIEGYLLLGKNNTHPLLSKEVFIEINKGLETKNCFMGSISYGHCDVKSLWCRKEYPS